MLTKFPIRARLTLWYLLLMLVTFIMIAIYLLTRFQNSLKSTIDTSLQITVSKTIAALDVADFIETGKLTFDHVRQTQVTAATGFAMRVLSAQGAVWDNYGSAQSVPQWGAVELGYSTQTGGSNNEEWRIYSEPIFDLNGQTIGWVQAAQSLNSVSMTLQELRNQLLLGIPLLLLFAGIGGYVLSNRALQPIQEITNTAQEITANDLSKRLDYQGAMDEVGRLAQTFDQMLERLQSSFERERRFTSDAAHELRTPLTVLKGQIDVTLSRPRNSVEYENKLRELSVQVDRLIRLSNALLFLSRSSQDQISFQPALVNLRELLDVLIEQLQPLAEEKELKLSTQISNEVFVYGDHDHLIRLFMNLLENALKYTPSNGEITVSAMKEDDAIQISVHNTGPGISAEHLPHLFERFYRVDEDRSSQTGGSGLGLAIAHEIVNRHGGKIEAQSSPGQGVTISVRLPLSNS
ncbi:MAG: heavy metal sensor histidine kinase [Anaerolineales bacterium]|nr:heavy metal sensor histidine kinase [Anaerolineales bacterium]